MSNMIKQATKCLFGICMLICFFASADLQEAKADDAIPLENITLKNASLYEGKTLTLKPIVTPAAAAMPELLFASSNSRIVTVSKTGLVKGISQGNATITVTASGTSIQARCVITVKRIYINKIQLKGSRVTINRGESFTLKKGISPNNATSPKVQWVSSNKRIVYVNSAGVIKGMRNGKATITAKALDGSKKLSRCVVTVQRHSINKKSALLRQGSSNLLRIYGARARIIWASSSKSIATVDSKGIVRARKKGTCTIAGRVGSERYYCKITVRNPYVPQIAALHSGESRTTKTNKIQFGITNYGKYTLKIEAIGYHISGSDYVARVKPLVLRNSSGKRISSLNIGSKRAVSVYYTTQDGKAVSINARIKVQFYFTYDGVKYTCVTDGYGNATYSRR